MRTVTAVVLALVFASSPARADLILQTDFARQQSWDVSSCVQARDVVACVGGTVVRGLNTTTGVYGFAYDFTRYFGPHDDGLIIDGWVCQLRFALSGGGAIVFPGAFGFCTPIGTGVFYAAAFNGQTVLVSGFADWAYASPTIPEYRGEALGPLTITDTPAGPLTLARPITTTTPEPSTFLLLALGGGILLACSRFTRAHGAYR